MGYSLSAEKDGNRQADSTELFETVVDSDGEEN